MFCAGFGAPHGITLSNYVVEGDMGSGECGPIAMRRFLFVKRRACTGVFLVKNVSNGCAGSRRALEVWGGGGGGTWPSEGRSGGLEAARCASRAASLVFQKRTAQSAPPETSRE